jgi:hypothetical protein
MRLVIGKIGAWCIKIRFWLPGRSVVAGFQGGLEKMLPTTGTEGSNPSPSSGEPAANFRVTANCTLANTTLRHVRRISRSDLNRYAPPTGASSTAATWTRRGGNGIRTPGACSRRVGPLGGMGTVTERQQAVETVPYLRGDRAFKSQSWRWVGARLHLCLG